ncbi:hypothetical protein VNO80_26797 [Phaseolus coccineus]|uniref:Uncharacterized protein n=1 Tax=Phaseolus coccineus TaxID=3886 RepID=A0AAN9LFE5_PHACN
MPLLVERVILSGERPWSAPMLGSNVFVDEEGGFARENGGGLMELPVMEAKLPHIVYNIPAQHAKGKTQIYRKGEKRKLFRRIESVVEKLAEKGRDALYRRSIVVALNLEGTRTVFDS